MKALIYAGPNKTAIVDKPIPKIENSNEAILRMVRTTICGTDLHIVRGKVPTAEVGRTLGHEGIGVVEEVGAEVVNFKKGDRVVIAACIACAKCTFCRKGLVSTAVPGYDNPSHWIVRCVTRLA
jgi:alcohol dehydrogenase